MALFVLIGRDGPRGPALRKLHRDAHLANLRPLADAGRVVFAGPLFDAGEQPCGSIVVFEADDLGAAQRFAATDPYVVQGIFQHYDVFASRQVFPGAGS